MTESIESAHWARTGAAAPPGDRATGDLLVEALAEYHGAVDAGREPSRNEFLKCYPEIAEELNGYLDGYDFVRQVAPQLCTAEEDATSTPTLTERATLGDFQIRYEIGRGGMGVVYEAEQISLGRRVALKVLPFAAMLDRHQLARFKNEARAAATLDHPNIVAIYSVGVERSVHFYAMQLIEGHSLAQVVEQLKNSCEKRVPSGEQNDSAGDCPNFSESARKNGTVSLSHASDTQPVACISTLPDFSSKEYFRTIAQLGIQAAEALDHAHQNGILHRDIKPANLMVDDAGKLWVTDFGLARIEQDAGMTMTGDLLGTLRYMSPEQALAKRVVVDHRSDIYSLGATLYELLTLRPAYAAIDRQELLRQIAFDEPRRPRQINSRIPQDLETIVLNAIEKNPTDRYATAQELADDLRSLLAHQPIKSKPPTRRDRVIKWSRRHPAGVRATLLAVLASAVVLAASMGWVVRDKTARQVLLAAQSRSALNEAETWYEADKLNEALSAVKRAEGLLASGGGNKYLVESVRQRRADLELVQRLDQIAINRAVGHGDDAYRDAFRLYGIDFYAIPPEDAAHLIRSSPVREKLIYALDSWSQAGAFDGTRESKGQSIDKRFLAVARLADPDPWRNRLRDAIDRDDGDALKTLAGDPETLNHRPQTILLLARSLIGRNWYEEAVVLLEQAQQRYPADFFINIELASSLRWLIPPRTEDAIAYRRAAVAIRPDSAIAYDHLAYALRVSGRLDEAEAAYRNAIRLWPDFAFDYYSLASLLIERGRRSEAEEVLRSAPLPKTKVSHRTWQSYAALLTKHVENFKNNKPWREPQLKSVAAERETSNPKP